MTTTTYTNGPFTITEKHLNQDGKPWIELELSITSGPIRVPVRSDEQTRQTVLRAEVLALAAIGQALQEAAGANQDEDETN